MNTPQTTLERLQEQHPEWAGWLAVVERALRPAASAAWEEMVPERVEGSASAPLLAGTSIRVDPGTIGDLVEALITTASRSGSPELITLRRLLAADVDLPALFAASVAQRRGSIEELAARAGVDREALDAVAGLIAVPFLQACHRRWAASIPEHWIEPYCPICGAWPAFAEVRGIERSRVFRCGRCGSGWHAQHLRCTFCGMDDHEELVSLVPENAGAGAVVDACKSCLGYVKTLSRLQGCAPGDVMIDDLATVHLDLAAVEAGYMRPAGAGHAVDVDVV